jgi:NAD(P)-dependent dehydrogenase (short-subunit alcohol dehydrogenase family)
MAGGLNRLAGKRALITGAGSGIGEATAILYAAEGAKVGLVARREQMLEDVAARIRADGGEALVLPCDVSKEPQVEAAFGKVVEAWGGLDVCVGVAGIEPYDRGDTKCHELELSVWNEVVGINLTGMFLTCKHAIREMLKVGGGSLIITGSPTGFFGHGLGETAYSSSKAGCHGLVRVLAHEYAGSNIRVNCVVPGFIDTPINSAFIAAAPSMDELCVNIPMKRPGRSDEVAPMNLWLATDEASYATGGFYFVDGGQTATV